MPVKYTLVLTPFHRSSFFLSDLLDGPISPDFYSEPSSADQAISADLSDNATGMPDQQGHSKRLEMDLELPELARQRRVTVRNGLGGIVGTAEEALERVVDCFNETFCETRPCYYHRVIPDACLIHRS